MEFGVGLTKEAQPTSHVFWDDWEMNNEEIERVASKFVKTNCYKPNPIAKDNVLQKAEPE
ncbi:hypothetical protein ACQFX9_21210 [Aliinostoc sp. HNIBRCY26]|uniref:hypothetical protein n=1 Tax=Aliinostoc sp. HNIBRCY26 TaxID=3418997 RepID=UPI003D02DBB7